MTARKSFPLLGCGLVVALVAAALIGLGIYRFTRFGAAVEQLGGKAAPIAIAITDPHTGQQASAGTPLLVHVDAGGQTPLVSLTLSADGQAVGVQSAPSSQGLTPFNADFAWTPAEPGTYSLMARGLDANQQSADSDVVVVIVGPATKAEDAAADDDTGQSLPISNGGGADGGGLPLPAPPAPPDPSDTLGPGQPWSLSLGDWLGGNAGGAPQAPELTAVPEGCGATLSIHDLSDNEDGFIVFRMTESAPTLTKIVTLDGQSALDWLTYTDESTTSKNSYMVRVFNGDQVADSNVVTVKGDLADCAQLAGNPSLLSIQLTGLHANPGTDDVYCYRSLNGIDWSRWPASGFFKAGADGFDVEDQAESILLDPTEGKPLSLDLECWGWDGGLLQLLGKVHKDAIGPAMGDVQLSDGGLVAGLDFGGPIKTKGDPQPKPPTDPKMPKIFAIQFLGPDACTPHLSEKGNNLFENLLYCTWYAIYNQDQGQSQPYLVWYVSNVQCVNGQGADCNSFNWYVQRAQQYNGLVGFHVYGQFSNSIPLATTPHDRTEFVVPPQTTCGEDTLFMTVRMFYQGGPGDPLYPSEMVEGPDSNTVTSVFNCPPPSEVKLDVTFDTLHIGDLGDGATGGGDLEIYASMAAEGKNPGSGSVLNLGFWGWSGSDCPDDSFVWYGLEGTLDWGFLDSQGTGGECPQIVTEGDVPFSDLQLCASDTYAHCVGNRESNNNKIQVTVADGSQLRVAIHAMDYDATSSDDDVCHTEKTLGPQSIFGWMDFTTSDSMSQGDNGSASCTVYFHIAPSAP